MHEKTKFSLFFLFHKKLNNFKKRITYTKLSINMKLDVAKRRYLSSLNRPYRENYNFMSGHERNQRISPFELQNTH